MPLDTTLIKSYIDKKINDISKLSENTQKRADYLTAKNKICYEQLRRYNACSAALIVIKENKDIPDEMKAGLCGIINSIKTDLNYDTITGRRKHYIDLIRLVNEKSQYYTKLIDWLSALNDAIP